MNTPRVHRLSNGVRVVCDPSREVETLALSVVVRGGARWERKSESGWAHLLEHMTFKGAGGRGAKAIVEEIEAAGGTVNAATGYERTSYQFRALRGGAPLAMEIAADLILRPDIDADELEREKNVVLQEIAEAADAPDDHVFELAQGLAYPNQPFGRPILGAPSSVKRADRDRLQAFRAALYAPDRIVVSAAGAIDEDELLALSEQAFGSAVGPSPGLPEPGPVRYEGGLIARARKLEQAHLVLFLPGVGAHDRDYYAFRLFAEALGGGMSSRLFQEAREKRGLAYSIDAFADPHEDAGLFGIYAGCSAKDAAPCAEVAAQEVRALTSAPEPGELARAKAQLKAHLFMARESSLARAEQAAGQLLLFDRLFSTAEIAAGIDAVSEADLRRVGERLLDGARVAGAVLGPKAAADAPERFRAALADG